MDLFSYIKRINGGKNRNFIEGFRFGIMIICNKKLAYDA